MTQFLGFKQILSAELQWLDRGTRRMPQPAGQLQHWRLVIYLNKTRVLNPSKSTKAQGIPWKYHGNRRAASLTGAPQCLVTLKHVKQLRSEMCFSSSTCQISATPTSGTITAVTGASSQCHDSAVWTRRHQAVAQVVVETGSQIHMGVSSSSWGYPNSWLVYKGKSESKIRMIWGYPHFRKPPHSQSSQLNFTSFS